MTGFLVVGDDRTGATVGEADDTTNDTGGLMPWNVVLIVGEIVLFIIVGFSCCTWKAAGGLQVKTIVHEIPT